MSELAQKTSVEWIASVYYAEVQIALSLKNAWEKLVDYKAWNPEFVDADVTLVRGVAGAEGETVLIRKPVYMDGALLPEFYAETVKLIPLRQIVWYVYPKDCALFRNFVDFGLTETPPGVRFNIRYYEQMKIADDLLPKHRQDCEADHQGLARAFKSYCEAGT
jgi:hypothetical protein